MVDNAGERVITLIFIISAILILTSSIKASSSGRQDLTWLTDKAA